MSSSEQYVPQSIDASLTSAMISDSLDVVGVRNNVMANHVVPLFEGARVLGRASTVQFEPSDEDSEHPYDDAIAYIDTLRPGNVAVIATGDNLSTAYWGELFSAAAIGRGAATQANAAASRCPLRAAATRTAAAGERSAGSGTGIGAAAADAAALIRQAAEPVDSPEPIRILRLIADVPTSRRRP